MKHVITIILLLSVTQLFAQDLEQPTKKKFDFAIKAGVNESSVSSVYRSGGTRNYFAGIDFNYNLTSKLSLTSGATYTKNGNYYFIQVPLWVKYNITKKLKAFAGARLDIMINDNNHYYNYRKNNIGTSLNFGLEYDISKHFFIQGYYSFSTEKYTIADYKNQLLNIQVGIGYKF